MVRTHKHQLKVKHMILQVATDKCIMAFLFLIVVGVIAIIVVKVCKVNVSHLSAEEYFQFNIL